MQLIQEMYITSKWRRPINLFHIFCKLIHVEIVEGCFRGKNQLEMHRSWFKPWDQSLNGKGYKTHTQSSKIFYIRRCHRKIHTSFISSMLNRTYKYKYLRSPQNHRSILQNNGTLNCKNYAYYQYQLYKKCSTNLYGPPTYDMPLSCAQKISDFIHLINA